MPFDISACRLFTAAAMQTSRLRVGHRVSVHRSENAGSKGNVACHGQPRSADAERWQEGQSLSFAVPLISAKREKGQLVALHRQRRERIRQRSSSDSPRRAASSARDPRLAFATSERELSRVRQGRSSSRTSIKSSHSACKVFTATWTEKPR